MQLVTSTGTAVTPRPSAGVAGSAVARRLSVRLAIHLALASLPVVGISADVLGVLPLHSLAIFVLLPLLAVTAGLVIFKPDRVDVVVLSAYGWGLVACAAYDAFRLPTIYGLHLWGDFFGSVGGWATAGHPSYVVGYLWRYLGDGGGIAVPFFVLAAALRLAERTTKRHVVVLAVAYAVCPVWSGLVLTDALAPAGHALFPLTPLTVALSLVGHLIYGTVLGIGCWHSRRLHDFFPFAAPRVQRRHGDAVGAPHVGSLGSYVQVTID